MTPRPQELVRRDRELGRLRELLAVTRRGEGRAALVTGSPGTGKTALVRAFTAEAAAAGAFVLHASASPAEQGIPLGVAGQLLSAVPGFTGPDPDPDAALPVVRDVLVELAATAPAVVIAVDDIEYTDELSARCLLHLCGRIGAARIMLLGAGSTYQPPHPPAAALPVAELARHPRCLAIALTTLDEDGVAGFLRTPYGGAVDPAEARLLAPAWHRATGGNPRLLHALAEDRSQCGPLRSARPVASAAFKRAVTGCLRPGGTRAAARALAVLGRSATLTTLARLLGVHERAVGPLMDVLTDTGLLESGRFRHEAARAAVLEELPPRESARLHTEAVELLRADGAGAETVARHLVAADGPGPASAQPWAVDVLAEAAEQALRAVRPKAAAGFLDAAHRRCPDPVRRAALLDALAGAEWESDPAAVTRHLPALEQALDAGRFEADRAAGPLGLLLWHGRPDAAARALDTLGEGEGAGERARDLRAGAAYVYPELGPAHGPAAEADRTAAVERAAEALVSRQHPAPGVTAALCALLYLGESDRAEHWHALLRETRTTPGALDTPARRAVTAAAAALVHGRLGRHAEAAGEAERALGLLAPEAWGIAVGMPLAAAVLAATGLGDHEEAARLLRIPVPEAMFRTRAAPHYLLARGRFRLAAEQPVAALGDLHACRDLMARWGIEPCEALDWSTPAARHQDPVARLSRAERRVAVLAAQGCTNQVIAARLFVTASTVEQHLTKVYRKLRVRSRTDLAELVGPGRPAQGVPS
ncbi:helix-turn-helix domain-containing protein [Streptomyces sp. ISL-44]|uniref:AAA family ATPase n=1 Tax=Streptomyces sp. ISL-44 TaxID=2819184 RepID=UPI001BE7945E|nr:LuxR family transcriptional regulator [Streptomyces sp. ISL-44]MBT2542062.1 helix-turn-helix domain-containing protein [Streptomyces sp. ISL-44]